eukprot:scaffold162396_cov11-Prasinocladus_malaysianus.AAC.1
MTTTMQRYDEADVYDRWLLSRSCSVDVSLRCLSAAACRNYVARPCERRFRWFLAALKLSIALLMSPL